MSEQARPWPSVGRTLTIAAVTTLVVAALSFLAPDEHANSAVGVAFLFAGWWTTLRGDEHAVRAFGMSLGGLAEPVAVSLQRLLRDAAGALGWALLFALIFFPPFWLGYRWWWHTRAFHFSLPPEALNVVLGQLLVIALPEEAFYRGFLQSSLDGRWDHLRVNILGARVGPGLLLSCAIFALGHLLTIPHPARLAVFGPALLFGWLRARTGGIGASVLFHAACNLFSTVLAHGYGLN